MRINEPSLQEHAAIAQHPDFTADDADCADHSIRVIREICGQRWRYFLCVLCVLL
jgi:hypothetical protein